MDDAAGPLTEQMIADGPPSAVSSVLAALGAACRAVAALCAPRTVTVNTRRLHVLRQLAEGGFSYVYLVEDAATREQFALKEVLCQSPEQRQAVRDEVSVHLAFASHPSLAPLVDYTFERTADGSERAYLLLPYYRRGSLQDFLSSRLPHGPFFDEPTALRLTQGLARAVVALHAHAPPLAHRDICPRNVMLADGGAVVLIDLGSVARARVPIATRTDAAALREHAETHSSMPYRAIELWDPPAPGPDVVVDERTDVWSMGATLYALAFGYSPFESQRGEDGCLQLAECTHLRTLGDVVFPTRHSFSSEFLDLIKWMLDRDAASRPTARAVLDRVTELLSGDGRAAGGGFVTVDLGRRSGSADFNPFAEIAAAAAAGGGRSLSGGKGDGGSGGGKGEGTAAVDATGAGAGAGGKPAR